MAWGSLTFSLVLIFLAMAVMLLVHSGKLHKQSGLPAGKVIYTDDETWYPNVEPLHSAEYRLVGKPDYLVRQRSGDIIPVEVKSRLSPQYPWPSHILQLAAYCFLVNEAYGKRPSYGILQYQDRAFAVDYTEDLEDNLLNLLAEMRQDSQAEELERDHNDARRCAACGFRENCHHELVLNR